MSSQIEEFKKNPVLIVAAFLLVALFGYVLYGNLVLTPRLSRIGWYTVGTAVDTYNPPKGGTVILVDFVVNGKERTASVAYRKGVKQGSRFLVKFLPSYPEKNVVLLNCPVPDSIVSIPAEGWEHPPFGCGGR
jgi:hypothetical protein